MISTINCSSCGCAADPFDSDEGTGAEPGDFPVTEGDVSDKSCSSSSVRFSKSNELLLPPSIKKSAPRKERPASLPGESMDISLCKLAGLAGDLLPN